MSNEARRSVDDDPNVAMQNSAEFAELRSRFRKFVFPHDRAVPGVVLPLRPALGLRPDFMGTGLRQHHVGLILGLGQFVSTFAITMHYVRWADREFDPRAEALATTIGRAAPMSRSQPSPPVPRPTVGNPALNIAIFALFVVVTLAIVIRASRNNRSAADYYAGGRAFTGRQNGIAIAGDYLSAATFLGIAGAIAINGYDGFLYSIGFLVAWLVALLLVAELLRNVGKYTMADVLSFRLQAAAGPHGRGDLHPRRLLLLPAGPDGRRRWPRRPAARHRGQDGQRLVIAVVGVIMIVYVLFGGMKGTTWVQIIKAVLLIIGAGIMTSGCSASSASTSRASLLGNAASRQAGGKKLLDPGLQYGKSDSRRSTSSRCRWPWCSAPPACRTC